MLSAKNVKIHGMMDERWTTRDKINQYRGVLKLYGREKRFQTVNAAKTKKKVSKDLAVLSKDVRDYRELITDVITGDKRQLRTTLQHHKDYQLAFQNKSPNEAYDAIYKQNDFSRKYLDKIHYAKKKKMKQFFDLQLECALLKDKMEQLEEYKPKIVQQHLASQYQQWIAKHSAARAIRNTYTNMLDILKKDTKYFNAVLEDLQTDQRTQCKILIKATEMGQLVTESLDDTRTRYKKLEHDVRVNMKERERTLEIVRFQVDDLRAYLQSLVRDESDTSVLRRKETSNETIEHRKLVQEQINELEVMFDKVKESMLVRSYEEIIPRFEEQMRQRARLTRQHDYNVSKRDELLKKKNHALLILATLEHGMISTTAQYKAEKKEMLERLELENKREINLTNARKAKGELLMSIRAALQNMLDMLTGVQPNVTRKTSKVDENKNTRASEDHEKVTENAKEDETRDDPRFNKAETSVLALLSLVSRKVGQLFAASGPDLDQEREQKARDLYQSYVADYVSNLKFGQELEPEGFYVEHETIENDVLSRRDLKLRSKRVVEANLKFE